MRRILHIWLPSLPIDRLTKRHPELAALPFVTTYEDHGRKVVAAANGIAQSQLIRPGMVLADARALLPELIAIDQDLETDEKLLSAVADWCDRYTPLVSLCNLDGLWLDVTGCCHLYGGEQDMLDHVLNSLCKHGYAARGALAGSPGTAYAVARFAQSQVVSQWQDQNALGPLPPRALRLSAETILTMTRLGLRTIGQVLEKPRASMARRFADLYPQLDRALGVLDEPISPRKPAVQFIESQGFAEPISTQNNIELVLTKLLERLCPRLEEAQRGARQLRLSCFCNDGSVSTVGIGTGLPSRSPKHLFRLFKEKLEQIDPRYGIDAMSLAATHTDLVVPTASTLSPDLSNDLQSEVELSELVDRLSTRLGEKRVLKALPVESYWPGRSVKIEPAISQPQTDKQWQNLAQRPLRILRNPEPIDVMAMLPDDPPMRFVWKHKAYRVRKADGPERLDPEWWRGQVELRDYYQVEDDEGCRYWLYRSGLYEQGNQPKWYLHGFFS